MKKIPFVLKIPFYYIICSLGNLLCHLLYSCIIAKTLNIIKIIHDNWFGFQILAWSIFVIYAPLCTFLACFYYVSRINVHIINHLIPYSFFPFFGVYLIEYVFAPNAVLLDYMLIGLFVAENFVIIASSYINHYHEINNRINNTWRNICKKCREGISIPPNGEKS